MQKTPLCGSSPRRSLVRRRTTLRFGTPQSVVRRDLAVTTRSADAISSHGSVEQRPHLVIDGFSARLIGRPDQIEHFNNNPDSHMSLLDNTERVKGDRVAREA